jgi:hypothetical protein
MTSLARFMIAIARSRSIYIYIDHQHVNPTGDACAHARRIGRQRCASTPMAGSARSACACTHAHVYAEPRPRLERADHGVHHGRAAARRGRRPGRRHPAAAAPQRRRRRRRARGQLANHACCVHGQAAGARALRSSRGRPRGARRSFKVRRGAVVQQWPSIKSRRAPRDRGHPLDLVCRAALTRRSPPPRCWLERPRPPRRSCSLHGGWRRKKARRHSVYAGVVRAAGM